MATHMYRIGKPKNGQRQREVRFDLSHVVAEVVQAAPVGTVQERYTGFFELPDRCVPFVEPPIERQQNSEGGFPAVLDLMASSESTSTDDAIRDEKLKVTKNNKKKRSLFAQHFDNASRIRSTESIGRKGEDSSSKVPNPISEEQINNLEVMADPFSTNDDDEHLRQRIIDARYALDPVHSDLASKCLRNVVSRQEQQIIKLFEILGRPIETNSSDKSALNDLLTEAKNNIEHIRSLYLEQIQYEESGPTQWRFARQIVDPFSDGAWTLNPIRRVLDVVQRRNPCLATTDDLEIIRLALLWTVLLVHERPLFFNAFVNVSEFYCRLAELYLIGPEVFLDGQIRESVSILLEKFLFDACQKGLLNLRLHRPIAFLDAFIPFYEDLLKQFEAVSSGDDNFALLLLIGAYMNSARMDGLLMAQTVWSPRRDIVRQILISEDRAQHLIAFLAEYRQEKAAQYEDCDAEFVMENAKLLSHYAIALRDGAVIPERNPALFKIATNELRHFFQKHKDGGGAELQKIIKEIHNLLPDKIIL